MKRNFSKMIRNIEIKRPNNEFTSKEHQKIYNISNDKTIQCAINLLNNNNVIALPTDTVYGLACNANDLNAIQKIYKIKSRIETKPIAICVKSIDDIKIWGKADHLEFNLLNDLLPGAITIVLDKSKNLHNPNLNPGTNKIGIRIPNYKFINDICKNLNYPLALTSANKSSEPSSLNIYEFKTIWHNLGGIFDGGNIGLNDESRSASTVIDLSVKGYFKIIREGIVLSSTISIMNKYKLIQIRENQ